MRGEEVGEEIRRQNKMVEGSIGGDGIEEDIQSVASTLLFCILPSHPLLSSWHSHYFLSFFLSSILLLIFLSSSFLSYHLSTFYFSSIFLLSFFLPILRLINKRKIQRAPTSTSSSNFNFNFNFNFKINFNHYINSIVVGFINNINNIYSNLLYIDVQTIIQTYRYTEIQSDSHIIIQYTHTVHSYSTHSDSQSVSQSFIFSISNLKASITF